MKIYNKYLLILSIFLFQIFEANSQELKQKNKYSPKLSGSILYQYQIDQIIDSQKNIGIKRLTIGGTTNSNLYLRAIDTGSESGRIALTITDTPFYGKGSDRTFASLIMDKVYTREQEEKICEEFNSILEKYRQMYNSMFLTNYRNSSTYARKRISFDVAYKLISYIIKKENF